MDPRDRYFVVTFRKPKLGIDMKPKRQPINRNLVGDSVNRWFNSSTSHLSQSNQTRQHERQIASTYYIVTNGKRKLRCIILCGSFLSCSSASFITITSLSKWEHFERASLKLWRWDRSIGRLFYTKNGNKVIIIFSLSRHVMLNTILLTNTVNHVDLKQPKDTR